MLQSFLRSETFGCLARHFVLLESCLQIILAHFEMA